ncbi:MAG TPA: long-chain-acyl-CoA synthetase [Xanthobacteraceae bacterium]|nr:long-chain-acyl-CoA synthetase [Xanthobacteraceae bacterium]
MSTLAVNDAARDLARSDSARKAWLRALAATAQIPDEPSRTLPARVEELAQAHGDALALIGEREILTYRQLAQRSNRYARWALELGITKGDTVCLLMPNRPEYAAIWLGVSRAGGTVALLNTSLSGAALAHCINLVEPRHIIVAAELVSAIESARPHLAREPRTWLHGADHPSCPRIDQAIARQSGAPLDRAETPRVDITDRALLIYTSGTTGLPKAANISHRRVLQWSYWFAGMMDTRPSDRMYDCLPMCHSVGGIVAIGSLLVNGGSVLIRDKFSAGRFWDDISRFDCTLFQYIGELCRYLVHAPPHSYEREHRLRIACGNGLKPDIWNTFKDRFHIPHILEFYAATEGSFSLYNAEGEPGAIGRIPPFLTRRQPVALVAHDVDKGEPVRGADGFCIRCSAGEAGEAIGQIARAPSPPRAGAGRSGGGDFEGYTSKRDSERKLLRDVFEPGDAWFRTGDLMRRDTRGFFYFVDRIGDTFRWKGENVATYEVERVMIACPGVREANVYGVTVPKADGRAGMAAVVIDERLDLATLHAHIAAHLPSYARPLFLRIIHALEVTTTFKHRKAELVRAGFDPSHTDDAIYFNDAERGAFVRMDKPLLDRLRAGRMKL